MRDSIIVSVSELRAAIQDVRRTGKEYVKLTISDSGIDDGEVYPASISLCACDSEMCIDFPDIDAPDNEAEIADSISGAAHMSSNLL